MALSFYCLQKFSPNLREVFSHAINYHNGLLPGYRGLKATAWSVYQGDKETGFMFHRMSKELDEGPILVQGAVPVSPDSSTVDLDLEKVIAAATNYIPHVLRMVVDGYPGEPQSGKGRCFSRADYVAVTRIPDPSSLSIAELTRRLRAFGGLRIRIANRWHKATKIREIPERFCEKGRCCFRTSDGVMVEPLRFRHLPYALVRGWVRKWLFGKLTP
ncbi:MAG TPA: formyltransferase family protein [Thermodesulfobacteriota bacterium]|nr:formyltransferase family protein [Thermodesulfobacteriota bacterium]